MKFMQGGKVCRRLGRLLRVIGVLVMASSFAGSCLYVARGWTPAPGLPGAFARLVADVAAPSGATPSPKPTGSASPGPKAQHGGPVTLSIFGNLSIGERVQQSSRARIGATPFQQSQSQGLENAGMVMEAQRRTEETTLSLLAPVGIGQIGARFGQLQATYATPRFALTYAGEPLSVFGAVPLGSTLRGFALTVPFGLAGDLTAFQGSAIGENLTTARVVGIRARRLVRGTFYEFGYSLANIPAMDERMNSLVLGETRSTGKLTEIAEGALQRRSLPSGNVAGYAYQVRLDYGGNSYWTVSLRRVSDGFLSLGSGLDAADSLLSLGYRANIGKRQLALSQSFETTGTGAQQYTQRLGALSFSGAVGSRGNFGLMLQNQRTIGAALNGWNGTGALQVGASIGRSSNLLLGVLATRSTFVSAGPQSSVTLQGAFQTQLGSLAAVLNGQRTRLTQSGQVPSVIQTVGAQFVRTFARSSLGVGATLTHIQTPVSDAVQTTPEITVGRQISPAISVLATFGEQILHDRLNPASDGSTRLFSLQLSAPFAFGNGVVQGRIDPRLPATITGVVVEDTGSTSPYAGQFGNGAGNIAVVLDGRVVQRTDLTGRFQFNFVSPGLHEVRIESSSLPRGVTADQPVISIEVQGGQTAQIFFSLGTFGLIEGSVYGRDTSGGLVPLQGVTLTLDRKGAVTRTGPNGSYAFGRLSAGRHTVQVNTASLPATAAFAPGQATQSVIVQSGQVAKLNFVAQTLGSIAGKVIYALGAPGKVKAGSGVLNSYVVAQPGNEAAIVNRDGSFLLDNLPPGHYRVKVDPETLPQGTGSQSPASLVNLAAGENVRGLLFTVGAKSKSVIFTFTQGAVTPPSSLRLARPTLPPGGATRVIFTAPKAARGQIQAFGRSYPLSYDPARKAWIGTVLVPTDARAGAATLRATAGSAQAHARLRVDPAMSILIAQVSPAGAVVGQFVVARVRFLTEVAPGDTILWENGEVTHLGKPSAAGVYTFSVRLGARPFRGVLVTHEERVNLTLR
ncbi:MAG: MSCRAMM family protein [Vulcanimicrobiaceae bacterium]